MGIYIKNMEMPESCFICPFKNLEICDEDCPLIEVPPHGRLIDADAIPWENQTMTYDDEWAIKAYDLEQMPTVIEAEEEA